MSDKTQSSYPTAKCFECGGDMRLETKTYLVMPPRIEWKCLKCGYRGSPQDE